MLTNFNLPDLPGDWLVPASGVEEVLSLFRAAQPDERKAFVLWEPYVTMALESEGAHVLMDSGEHSDEAGNLMRDETSARNTSLSPTQCARMRGTGSANGLLK